MTDTILIAGTASHVGKSTVAAGLCRHLANRGVSVTPFKAQNMSNNARVALTPSGAWGEIGISQYVQARAARSTPTTDVNPVLLKPHGDGVSQLVVQGQAVDTLAGGSYYDTRWEEAKAAAIESYERLASDHEVVVAEGAGSIAEINLRDRDLANLETARFTDAKIVLTVDIERGGAFASLYGTVELLPADVREQVVGAILTKFRGNQSLLASGIEAIESRTGVPVLGVIPHDDPGLPEEDSLSLPSPGEAAVLGADDGVPEAASVTIAVPRLPRLSNAADIDPLVAEPGVRVAILPPSRDIDDMDAILIPGSKNTLEDLETLKQAGFGDRLASFDGPIVGICGGYQLLGERLVDADATGSAAAEQVEGFGLLPVETRFGGDKRVERVTRTVDGVGPLAGATGSVSGYEIHVGETTHCSSVRSPVGRRSAVQENVLGTYLHGLFENEQPREAFVRATYRFAGTTRPSGEQAEQSWIEPGSAGSHATGDEKRRSAFEAAAMLVSDHVDLTTLGLPGDRDRDERVDR